jgi:adenylyl- and sulfurtransferase ThiI
MCKVEGLSSPIKTDNNKNNHNNNLKNATTNTNNSGSNNSNNHHDNTNSRFESKYNDISNHNSPKKKEFGIKSNTITLQTGAHIANTIQATATVQVKGVDGDTFIVKMLENDLIGEIISIIFLLLVIYYFLFDFILY